MGLTLNRNDDLKYEVYTENDDKNNADKDIGNDSDADEDAFDWFYNDMQVGLCWCDLSFLGQDGVWE